MLVAAILLVPVRVCSAPACSAKSAILMDGTSGRVLWEHNADETSLIASTTKIMTALLIAEQCDPAAEVRIPRQAVGVEGSSMYLREGELLTVEQLLYGMMLHSGNDAAAALAIYHSGSVEMFAEAMNRKAKQLGLEHTVFANPHGLDDASNRSTARDLAELARYAMDNSQFHRIVSTKTFSAGERVLTNHNKLLWRYDGAVGVKTGYTKAAGRILVSCAERNGRRLIAVTIHDRNDWADHANLLDHGFSGFAPQTVVEVGSVCGSVCVISGGEETAEVVTDRDVVLPLREHECVSLVPSLPMFVFAPVLAGEPAGSLSVRIDGAEVMKIPLYWRYSVLEEP